MRRTGSLLLTGIVVLGIVTATAVGTLQRYAQVKSEYRMRIDRTRAWLLQHPVTATSQEELQ